MATANPISEDDLVLEINRVSEIDYKSKTQSIISACDRGTDNEQLYSPHGVTVDHSTGYIYVADYFNKCVKVFDDTAEYLFKFGDGAGEENMTSPSSLLICGIKILVTQLSGCLLVYQLDGKYISRISCPRSENSHFHFHYGLSNHGCNGDVYICDSFNNRIQIFSVDNFRYKSEFGKDILRSPHDVKLYKDNIFILDASNPCLHIFNKDLVLQKSVVTRGEGQQVISPYYFFIDKFGSILISDRNSNSILILSSEFEFIHRISVSSYPMGITMDKEDRVIVVCNAANNCLQIF